MELTIKRKDKNFQEQMQDLLSKKDKLVKQDAGDGRNKYQVAINNLKKKIKKYNKDLKNNEPKVKFNSLLQGVKKQEREGKFDRGAEGKAKNKLRKKMAKGMETIGTAGRHAGSPMDKKIKSNMKKIESGAVSDQVGGTATKVDIAKAATGETVSQRKARKNKMTKAKIAKSR